MFGLCRLMGTPKKVFKLGMTFSVYNKTGQTMTNNEHIRITHPSEGRIGNVGHIMDHLAAVVDGDGKIVPRGQHGDLLISGYSSMYGYLNIEEATRAVIGKDRWYGTGNTLVMNDNGVSIVSCKDMIIHCGENIYPTDVDIDKHPAVSDVQVIDLPDARSSPVAIMSNFDGQQQSMVPIAALICGFAVPDIKFTVIRKYCNGDSPQSPSTSTTISPPDQEKEIKFSLKEMFAKIEESFEVKLGDVKGTIKTLQGLVITMLGVILSAICTVFIGVCAYFIRGSSRDKETAKEKFVVQNFSSGLSKEQVEHVVRDSVQPSALTENVPKGKKETTKGK